LETLSIAKVKRQDWGKSIWIAPSSSILGNVNERLSICDKDWKKVDFVVPNILSLKLLKGGFSSNVPEDLFDRRRTPLGCVLFNGGDFSLKIVPR
jgi:hypothetical protein